jgi:hypothetical protein
MKKNTFTLCNLIQNPKTTFVYTISLFYTFSLLYDIYFLFILFCYSNTETLCLTTTRWSWDTRQNLCFAGCFDKDERSFYDCPQEFDIKPQVTLVGKILLLQHSHLESQHIGALS